MLPKDTTAGPFAEDWKKAYATLSNEVEEVDISPALSATLSVKDTDELVSFACLRRWDWLTRQRYQYVMRRGHAVV